MDILKIVDIALEDFNVFEEIKLGTFKFSQICAVCFKITNVYALNNLVFQGQNLQDILAKTTSFFNFEELWEKCGQPIACCQGCLKQLLASYLFQSKVLKAYEVLETIIRLNIKGKEIAEETDLVKVEVFLESDHEGIKAEENNIDHEDDDSDTSDLEFGKPEINHSLFDTSNKKTNYEAKKKITRTIKSGANSKKVDHVCPICKRTCKTLFTLNRHMAGHASNRPQECKICSKVFKWPYNLVRHMLIHTGEKPYVCDKCGKGFRRNQSLLEHQHAHAEEQLGCEICGKVCKNRYLMNVHLKNKHPETGIIISIPTKNQKICHICGKMLSPTSFTQHLKSHNEREIPCDYCDKKFTTKALKAYHLTIHTGEKRFACEKCGKLFRSSMALKTHLRVHTDERPYSCSICPSAFKQSVHLKRHLRFHEGIKNFACDECGKCFLEKSNLTQHKRIHTGIKKFICELCEKGFITSSCLKKHRTIHFYKKQTSKE